MAYTGKPFNPQSNVWSIETNFQVNEIRIDNSLQTILNPISNDKELINVELRWSNDIFKNDYAVD